MHVRGMPRGARGSRPGRDLHGGASVRGSDIEVHLASKPTRLSGRVTAEEEGEPVDGCTVVVFSSDERRWSWPSTRYLGSARAEPGGAFLIEGLPPGSYLAIALGYVETGQWRDPEFLSGAARHAIPVTLGDSAQRIFLSCHGS